MKIPLVQAVAWIVGSMLIVTGGTHKGLQFYQQYQAKRKVSYLSRIVQTGPQREALKTTYLAELMQICADRPTAAAFFDPGLARGRLLASPVIKEAFVRLTEPDTIFIDYTVRQPAAWLYDFENIALDEEGYPFPVYPFFTPKKLPEIYLGIQQFSWNQPLSDQKTSLALMLLQLVNKLSLQMLRLDVSQAFHKSLAGREIIVILDEKGFTKTLRLTPKKFAQELGNYLELRDQLPPEPQIIDLRIPQLAFLERACKPL